VSPQGCPHLTVRMRDGPFQARGYQNRSEAVRDLVRAGLVANKLVANRSGECVASLASVFDRRTRDLPKRLENAS
jgi:CopG family nickel-responsive transcriptional regulator